MNYWWVVARVRNTDHGWHWNDFLANADSERGEWGGPDWIRSSRSYPNIENMSAGDIVVAHQSGEGVLGLAYLSSKGYQYEPDGNYNCFDLAPTPNVRLNEPVGYPAIRDLPYAKQHIEFVRFHQASVFGMTPHGFDMILDTILRLNPSQEREINDFIITVKKMRRR
jgi:hypothetical protein